MQFTTRFSEEWRVWHSWLAPFFALDKMLPYTFLALLGEKQLIALLQESDETLPQALPFDGILACALQHIKVGGMVSDNVRATNYTTDLFYLLYVVVPLYL